MCKLKKLTPEVLMDTIVEIRFATTVPPAAVFGMIYGELSGTYNNTIQTGIASMPMDIVNQNPEFNYFISQKIYNDEMSIGIGNRIISFNCVADYIGWDNYYKEITKVIEILDKKKLFSKIERLGSRYVSFFENKPNFFQNTNINFSLDFGNYVNTDNLISIQLKNEEKEFEISLTINSPVEISINGDIKQGNIVDIDIGYNNIFEYNIEELLAKIYDLHEEEKNIFLKTIKKEFLKEDYNAVFEE